MKRRKQLLFKAHILRGIGIAKKAAKLISFWSKQGGIYILLQKWLIYDKKLWALCFADLSPFFFLLLPVEVGSLKKKKTVSCVIFEFHINIERLLSEEGDKTVLIFFPQWRCDPHTKLTVPLQTEYHVTSFMHFGTYFISVLIHACLFWGK